MANTETEESVRKENEKLRRYRRAYIPALLVLEDLLFGIRHIIIDAITIEVPGSAKRPLRPGNVTEKQARRFGLVPMPTRLAEILGMKSYRDLPPSISAHLRLVAQVLWQTKEVSCAEAHEALLEIETFLAGHHQRRAMWCGVRDTIELREVLKRTCRAFRQEVIEGRQGKKMAKAAEGLVTVAEINAMTDLPRLAALEEELGGLADPFVEAKRAAAKEKAERGGKKSALTARVDRSGILRVGLTLPEPKASGGKVK